MKLSLNWLQRYIDHGLTPEELAHRLTMAGLEVESVEKIGDDTVFELEITPNRPDCLSILGLAREVSAITDKDLLQPAINEYEEGAGVDIAIEDTEGCGRYIGTLIEDIQVKALGAEYSRLLQALALKPISNIVDITNFVLFETGQPLHAFDFDKLEGGKIIVRRARKGEKIVTLDDVERKLDESIVVIADAKKPVAIAGIMGGRDTGVTASTKRMLLESASFDLGAIRRASRKLGLTSDSCYRFERGVAWKNVETGSNRATDLILEIAGGQAVARQDIIAKTPAVHRTEITVTAADVEALLGAPLEFTRCGKILRRLGCIVAAGDKALTVVPPKFRADLRSTEDLIEELARVVGYDNLPMSLPEIKAENIVVDLEKEKFNERVAELMVAQGFHEAVTYSLVSRAALEKINYVDPVIALQNPMSAEQAVMRPTTLANLLEVAVSNLNRGQKDLKLFEVGKKYFPPVRHPEDRQGRAEGSQDSLVGGKDSHQARNAGDPSLPSVAQNDVNKGSETWTLSALAAGRRDGDWRRSKKDVVDFYDLKGALEEALAKLRVRNVTFVASEISAFEPGQCACVVVNGKTVGLIGKVANDVLVKFDIKKASIFFAEIDLEIASDAVAPREKFAGLNEFPAAVRDISLAVKDTSFEAIRSLCQENGRGLLQKIDFVELYTGDKIESGHKGYVVSLTYQASDRTLTDEEVNKLHEEIVEKLISKCGVVRR